MTCARCRGLMVPADLADARRSVDCASGWQCLQCGEVTDAVIQANRRGHLEPQRSGARPPGSPALSSPKRRHARQVAVVKADRRPAAPAKKPKTVGPPAAGLPRDVLTCDEAPVDALLSEGESTWPPTVRSVFCIHIVPLPAFWIGRCGPGSGPVEWPPCGHRGRA